MPSLPTNPKQILRHPHKAFEHTDWHQALDRDDSDAARDAFVRAVRTGEPRTCGEHDIPALYRRWLDGHEIGFQGGHWLDPDMVVNKRYIGCYGIEHSFEGEIDWLYDPTANWGENRTREWQVQLNRHYQWVPLADKYHQTGNAKYAQAFEEELRSWVRQCPRPDDNGMGLPGTWRLIEVGIRAGWTWPYAFEMFRRSEHVSDEAIWLMICALHEHGMHLLLWPTGRNFKTMESNGLTHVGAMFPELRMAHTFLTTGIDRVTAELERQVYPDGLQDELAPSYGIVALSNLYSAVQVARQREGFRTEVPRRVFERLADMAEAIGRIADPEAKLPPIHDSPAQNITGLWADFREHVDPKRFARQPWQANGIDHLPWGGWTILRREGRYTLFDAGPWGTGHQHADALQLLTYAYGRWLCIDPGKPLYNQSGTTRHIRSSAGHNVVLIDGRRHRPEPQVHVADAPWPTAVHDEGTVHVVAAKRRAVTADDEAETRFWHERVVLEVAPLGWVIYDRLQAEDQHPHTWEWLWHIGADRVDVLDAAQRAHAAYDGGPGLLIETAGALPVGISVARGDVEPKMRGWRSTGPGDEPTPTPTLRIESEPCVEPVGLVTLLVPAADEAVPRVQIAEADVTSQAADVTVNAAGQQFTFTFVGDDAVERVDCRLPGEAGKEISLAAHTHG